MSARGQAIEAEAPGRTAGAALLVPAALLAAAAAGWWWSQRTAGDHGTAMDDMGMSAMGDMTMTSMSLGAFVVAWVAMMAAMMLPAILPVVRLYALAAARGRAAPTAVFSLGYLAVWSAMAVPAYVAWRALEQPLADGRPWVGRVAGATFLVAALWQVTPLKSACLRHCRSPLGFIMRFGSAIRTPLGALRMGATHAAFCFGCCWAIFAVLVVLGTMNLAWMAALTALIVLEKHAPRGQQIASAAAVLLAGLGTWLLLDPSTLTRLT